MKKADIQIHIFKVNQRLLTKTRVNHRRRRLRRRLSAPAGKFSFILFYFFFLLFHCVLVSVIVAFLLCVCGVSRCVCVCWCVYLCLPIDTRIYFGSSRGKISIGLVHYLLHFDYALTCNYSTQRADIHYVYILYIYTVPDTIVTPRGKQLFHCA